MPRIFLFFIQIRSPCVGVGPVAGRCGTFFLNKIGNWHIIYGKSCAHSAHWDGSGCVYSGIVTGVAVLMLGWVAGGMGSVLYPLFGSKWGRNFGWDGTWWDGKRVSRCVIPIPFPSYLILNGIPIPFVPMQA